MALLSSDIRLFFSANVVQSAWGIATHKAARMLAVSSNTHRITVFAFALRSAKSDGSGFSSGSDDDLESERPGVEDPEQNPALPGKVDPAITKASTDRSCDITIELHGHDNIPGIAFCNTEDDLEGRYLVSTDILGTVIVWDVWARAALKKMTPEDIWRGHGMPGPCPTSGWNVLCLDFRAFRPVRSEVECFGCRPRIFDKACDIEHSRGVLSVRREAERVLQNHNSQQEQNHQQDQNNQQDQDSQEVQNNHQSENDHQGQNSIHDHSATQDDNTGEMDEEDQMDVQDENDQDIDMDGYEYDDEEDFDSFEGEMSPTSALSDNLLDPNQTNAENPNSLLHGADFRRISELSGIDSVSRQEQHDDHNVALPQKVPFLILWASDHNLALFGPRFDQPATIMINALQQVIPESSGAMERLDRLNMSAQIPELGIIIIASYIGRVAVLSLNTRKMFKGSKRSKYCAFRVDWFLPFKSQEDELLRPIGAPLLGIAVSPIQGQQPRPRLLGDGTADGFASRSPRAGSSSRRYRLMLTYWDQTVLSYELGRSGDGVDDGEVLIF
ncbi:hypothetical protein MMC30_005056 [Trapelia coarctata]|nr:hypothetical protein [Trapelia coarctata]